MMDSGNGFLADTHVHSRFSQDSESQLSDICRSAREKQIDAVCITDHCDVKPDSDMQKLVKTREDVYREVSEEKCPGVELLLGVELACGGFYPRHDMFEQVEETMLRIGHYDCVIGSVHSVGTTSTARNNYASMEQRELTDYMKRYCDAALSMLTYGHPDVLAHLTYPLRYINGKFQKGLDWRTFEDKVREVYSLLIQKNIALEVNTSCLGTNYDYLMPENEMLRLYLEMGGGLLTLGSDAHKPEHLGKGFSQTMALLKSWGVEQLYYVKNRQLIPYKI